MTRATHSEREKFVAGLVRRIPAAESYQAAKLMRLAGFYSAAQGSHARCSALRRALAITKELGCTLKATEAGLWLEIEGEDWTTLLSIPPI